MDGSRSKVEPEARGTLLEEDMIATVEEVGEEEVVDKVMARVREVRTAMSAQMCRTSPHTP